MKLFIDTNVWLRFLIADDLKFYLAAEELMDKIEQGAIQPYTSSQVLMEVAYVLQSYYSIKKNELLEDIDSILATRNLVVVEKSDFNKAIELYRKINVKLTDCLISTQIAPGVTLCTFDKEFSKLKHLKVITPLNVVGD